MDDIVLLNLGKKIPQMKNHAEKLKNEAAEIDEVVMGLEELERVIKQLYHHHKSLATGAPPASPQYNLTLARMCGKILGYND